MKRYLEPNITQGMIAEELWISLSNVKVIIHRAKKKLKEKYQQCCYQNTDGKWTIIDTWCSRNCWCDNSVVL
jgi:orotate phosphoribosyltransferase-like protein